MHALSEMSRYATDYTDKSSGAPGIDPKFTVGTANALTIRLFSGQESAAETVNSGSIPGRVKPKTIKIDIHSFLARRSAIKGTA